MRLLVTGAAGFIGSAYIRMVLAPENSTETVHITVLDKLTYAGTLSNIDLDHPQLRFVKGDVRDAGLVDELMAETDQVVHFAAESHVDRSIAGDADFVSTNVTGTWTLLNAALRHGVEPFVLVSTDEVYGSITEGSWTEEQPLRPNSPYAASKAAADLISLSYQRTHGLDVRITRCSNNYGPRQYPEKVIPLFITRLLEGGTVPLYGDGHHVREWLHVEDHCRGVESVRTRGRAGEVYNIGGGTELTNRDLTSLLLDACGADWDRVRYVPDRKGHDRRYSLDDGKARRELGYRPRIDFTDGLAGTVQWHREHRDWWV
ncbi:dTDP-glucose 4,6-dehydratase [Nocardiopsis dassonvillei]|uniref:dTDP-glucose 4,6-dehydratase n=1 Tax=Nocardiopsis dassonvillei TaxID=2014 RepID=UPI0036322E7A